MCLGGLLRGTDEVSGLVFIDHFKGLNVLLHTMPLGYNKQNLMLKESETPLFIYIYIAVASCCNSTCVLLVVLVIFNFVKV